MKLIPSLLALSLTTSALLSPLAAEISVIPKPAEAVSIESSFAIPGSFHVTTQGIELGATRAVIEQQLQDALEGSDQSGPKCTLQISATGALTDKGEEAYIIDLVDSENIIITAAHTAGVFRAVQTLVQLLPDGDSSVTTLPRTSISDYPRFGWRGMHLDESRHFFGVEAVKRYIDLIARYKMNVFHWHFIDDGGWRIEIKKYPRLTEIGGFRKGTKEGWDVVNLTFADDVSEHAEGDWYGGYYTQEEIKDIVAYAAARHIRVIPEIEMPGHSLPALAAYPHLRCGGDLVSDSQGWTPNRQNSYCAGKDESFEFLEDVLTEVFELFPDKDVHIGGDEVIKEFWAQCPHCIARKEAEGLKNVDELQSYFIRRVEKFINANDKNLIGWDEITHGGLAPNATVMFWIGMGAVPETVQKGHDVIMTPTSPCYFDYAYSSNSTEKVYNWEPVPAQFLGTEYESQFLGAQGNVWTERMEDFDRVEYMVLPRMLAMAETLWTPAARKNEASFLNRLEAEHKWFNSEGLNFHLPTPKAEYSAFIFSSETEASFTPAPEGFNLRYTTNGSEPTVDSKLYTGPIQLKRDTTVRAVIEQNGRISESELIGAVRYTPAEWTGLQPGLHAQYVDGRFQRVPDFETLDNITNTLTTRPDISAHQGKDDFAVRFLGFIEIKQAGDYTFTLTSDDGSVLKLANATVVNHDGPHGPSPKSGKVKLAAGLYPFELGYMELGGGETLEVDITFPDGTRKALPAEMLFRTNDLNDTRGEITIEVETTINGQAVPLSTKVNYAQAPALKSKASLIAQTLQDTYAPMLKMTGRDLESAHKHVPVTFRPGIKFPAYAQRERVTISADHLLDDPDDTIGVFIHELSHVLQDYQGKARHIGWFREGHSDYVRYKLNPNDKWSTEKLYAADKAQPLGSYRNSTAFLLYLEDTYNKPIAPLVSGAIIRGEYTHDIWEKLTGKPLETLTAEYTASDWKVGQ